MNNMTVLELEFFDADIAEVIKADFGDNWMNWPPHVYLFQQSRDMKRLTKALKAVDAPNDASHTSSDDLRKPNRELIIQISNDVRATREAVLWMKSQMQSQDKLPADKCQIPAQEMANDLET